MSTTNTAGGDDTPDAVEPLDPTLAELFATTSIAEPSARVRARVLGRVAHTIAAASIAPASTVAKTFGARSVAALATATFAIGGVVGAIVTVAVRPAPPPQVIYVDRPTPSDVRSVTTAPPSAIAPAPPMVPSVRAPSSVPSTSPPPTPSTDTLGVERRALDEARSKLASGDPGGALRQLTEHEQRFPKARLAEEREALAVQALVNEGRKEDARARAKAFRDRWPTSVYRAAVDATIESIP